MSQRNPKTLLIIGGHTGNTTREGIKLNTSAVVSFDPSSGCKRNPSPHAFQVQQARSVTLPDSTVLTTGGFITTGSGNRETSVSARCVSYNGKTDKHVELPNMNFPRGSHALVLLPSGNVITFGGITMFTLNGGTDTVELYGANSKRWTVLGVKLPFALSDMTATVLDGSKVLITGGKSSIGYHADCWIFDSTTNTFTDVAPMSDPRCAHAAVLLPNGNVFVSGGCNDAGELKSCVIYNPKTNMWSDAPDMLKGRRKHSTFVLEIGGNKCVFLVGGAFDHLADPENSSAQTMLFDLSKNEWKDGPTIDYNHCYASYALY